MKFWRRWKLIRWTALAFATAAIVAPAAQALRPVGDGDTAVPVKRNVLPVQRAYGLDWTEVGIGSALGVILLTGGGIAIVRRSRETQPIRV